MRPSEENIPNNILIKVSESDPEKKLQEVLYKKYGERFINYRENYKKTISDDDHKYFFKYPITVVLELVNRCDLQCVMCYQGFRNDAEKLRDKQLQILEDSLPVVDSNQVYYFELEGLKVMNLDNFELGKIKGILETNANDVLVIEPTDSSIDERERLVPYLKDQVVKEINKIEKTITIDWSEDY